MKPSKNLKLEKVEHLDIDSNTKIILNNSDIWKSKSRMWGDKLHRICTYVAMFSPALANYFIEKYSNENDVVLDTFSGRGTTLLEARLCGRKSYAIDLNPFAFVLSKSKSSSLHEDEVLARIDEWEKKWKIANLKNEIGGLIPSNLNIYYSDFNLRQLEFIKRTYGENWNSLDELDNFILAICLGIMHGPMRKNGSSIYFSLSMSNHTSMSPNYVRKYASVKKLLKPIDNIFNKIRNRVKHILKSSKFSDNNAHVVYGNSLNLRDFFPDIRPKLIFTSPPYLNIVNYTQQNWIKMWLLGFTNKEQNNALGLDDKHSIQSYKAFMTNYLHSLGEIVDTDAKVILVIGDVQKFEKVHKFEDIWDEIRTDIPNFTLSEIYIDEINQNKKATNAMGNRAGKATRIDKIFVFSVNQ